MSETNKKAPADLQIIAELKDIWSRYSAYPQVRSSLKQALADGQVTERELLDVRASIDLALALEAARQEGGTSGLTAEDKAQIEQIREEFSAGSEPALALNDALKDGQISPEERLRLRSIVRQAKDAERARALESKAAPRALAFPTLIPKAPWRAGSKDDSDSGWGK